MEKFRQHSKSYRSMLIALLVGAFLLGLTACTEENATQEDILTQKASGTDKIPVTVLVKYAFTIDAFEKAVEEQFPDIDLIQVGNYTRDMGIAEYEARLEHDDLTDIVMTWPLEVGQEYWKDRLLDLSGMDFTSRYNMSMLNSISTDGSLYYLPGPAQIRGIVYNKTLFKENGWTIPQNFDEFIALCQTIEQSGIRALQLGFKNQEVLDTAFVGYNFGDCFSKPQDLQQIDNYNQGNGSFGDQFGGALDVFQQMIDAGVWKPADLKVDYSQREKMFFNRKCAMIEDSALMCGMGFDQTGTTDEFALMPFFNPGNDNDWARIYMVCYIGLNKHLEEVANKETYDAVLRLMDYISTEEGQNALAADTGAMFSSLTNIEQPEDPQVEALLPALNHGRYAIFPTLKNAQSALREGLKGMIEGKLSKAAVIRMVDEQNLSSPAEQAAPTVLGSAGEDFTLIETGNFVADTLRAWGDSQVALFLDNGKDGRYNGKGISGRIYKGDVTTADIDRVMPDLKADDNGALWKASISGEDLLDTLEHSVPVENNKTGWIYYFSGLKMDFDPTAKLGERVKNVTTETGDKIEPKNMYTIVVTEGSVKEEYLEDCVKTETLSYDIITEAVREQGTISPAKDGRFTLQIGK